ncbi:MAG TPA: fumarylacetoacetase, partial [Herpetosiphonaceae bacterium]
MSPSINETHDPALRSWVESANAPGADFPIQNLPFGAFLRAGHAAARIGVAIGDQALDLESCVRLGLLDGLPEPVRAACQASALNPLMALGPDAWSALRLRLSRLLREGAAEAAVAAEALVPQSVVELLLPAQIGDYTDFYASIYHATNVGVMLRPDNPLLPNYKYVPIGYHGRASSIVASGAPVRRPAGQLKGPQDEQPAFAPCKLLDYEAEIGFFVGPGNEQGERIALGDAERHIFGLCLVNDWSARDIQTWEYQPLGPFLAKSFATSLSPWVVTLEALAPFRAPAFARPAGDPAPLPYLSDERNAAEGGIGITVEIFLATQAMRERGEAPVRLSRGSFRDMYWTIGQMLAHHASNGCNLRPGDLLASGTVSGADPSARGCLLELTWRGAEPITLPDGEERR